MPWVRNEPVKISRNEKIGVVVSIFFGLLLLGVFLHFGLNIFRPEKIVDKVVSNITSNEFKIDGSFGYQIYHVSIQTHIHDSYRTIIPLQFCPDILVIDLKFRIKNAKNLKDKLMSVEGVSGVEVYNNRIIINRQCVPYMKDKVFWRWPEVWANIKPILEKFFSE